MKEERGKKKNLHTDHCWRSADLDGGNNMGRGSTTEYGETEQIFTNPGKEQTQQYITGRFG